MNSIFMINKNRTEVMSTKKSNIYVSEALNQNTMKISIIKIIGVCLALTICYPNAKAGNEQRVAQAGASELLINPWAISSGLGEASIASIRGLESVFGNVAGTAHLNKTQIVFSNTTWLKGADINVMAFGLSQRIGDAGVLSLTVNQMDWGEIAKTTVELPDGDGSVFHPRYTNIGVSFAKEFSNSIFGGVTVKVINENISNLGATGVAFDAGIQYITGSREQIKFGITMKNVGPTLKMEGDGMSFSGSPQSHDPVMTAEMRSADIELPMLIKLGFAYDWDFGDDHNLEAMGAFTENSFFKNQFHAGLQYSFKNMFQIRGGYIYEDGITNTERSTVFTGLSAGFSLEVPVKKGSDQKFAIDYSYRDTDPFKGVHSIGVRISL